MLSVLLTIALTATTPAAVAAATPAPQAASVSATAPAEEKKICRRIEASESRLGAKRVCKTAADWKLDQEGSQRGKKD